jgi:Zn-dependent alcohol dehydrogenase
MQLPKKSINHNERYFPMKTLAAVLYQPHTPFVLETLDLEPPRAGEVLIKMAAAGVCHSDWHLVSGATNHAMPVVAGHEGAGIVEAEIGRASCRERVFRAV